MDYGMDRWRSQVEAHREEMGDEVTLHWQESAGGKHPVHGAPLGTVTAKEEKATVFLHFVSAQSVVRQFTEIQAGDVMMDYAPELALEGRSALWVEIDGKRFTQKRVSNRLHEIWDASVKAVPTMKTMVLERSK